MRAERYLKIDASPEETRVVVSLNLGASEALRVLEAADANRDGTVAAPEADAYLAQWAAALGTELPIELDGERADVRWADAWLDPVGPVRAVPVTVEIVGHLAPSPGRRRLTIADGMRARAIDRTDVAFRARDGVTLVASGLEPRVDAPTADLAFGPARDGDPPRRVTAVLDVPGSPPWVPTAVGLAAVAIVGLSAAAWVGLRRSRPRT